MDKQPSIVQIAPVLAGIFIFGGLCAGFTMMEEQKKRDSQVLLNSSTLPYYSVPAGCRIIVRTHGCGHHNRCQFRRDVGMFDTVDKVDAY